jgi:hypothetical protein
MLQRNKMGVGLPKNRAITGSKPAEQSQYKIDPNLLIFKVIYAILMTMGKAVLWPCP